MPANIFKQIRLLPVLALVITGCAGQNPQNIKPSNEDIARYQKVPSDDAIAELEASLAKLRVSQDLNFFAPSHFELASKSLDDARHQLKNNAPREQVVQKVATAEAVLRNGQRVAKQVRTLLENEISIKENLDELNTKEVYANEYSSLVERLSKVIRDIENGKSADTKEVRPKLIADMQELEIRAVRHEALRDAEDILKRVTNSGGKTLAPNTYQEAQEVFRRAEEFILANAHDKENVKKVAGEALFAAKRALTITSEVAALDHKSKLSLEQVVLDEEYRLFRVARGLGIKDPRTNPLEVQSELISKAALDLIDDRGYHEQMTNILRDAVVRQAEINNEPALLEEIKNLKRERSELLAKEALYGSKVAELKQQLEKIQLRAINAEGKLNAIVQTAQPKQLDIVEKAVVAEGNDVIADSTKVPGNAAVPNNTPIKPGALGAFADSEL